jgi:lsr operon transcriptional repressor
VVDRSYGNGGNGREDDAVLRERLVRVAWYYYRDDLTQAQIANRLHVSRPTVARLLARARLTGVVTIDIDTSGVGGLELAEGLRRKYELQEVVIVPQLGRSVSGEVTNSRIAQEAATFLRRFLRPGAVIGVGWGDTVLRTLLALSRASLTGVSFPTLTGGIDAYTTKVNGAANNGISEYIKFVPSPLLASSPAVASALRQERAVTSVLDIARSADVTLIGIGGAIPNATILRNGVVTEAQIREYQEKGAVGDIIGEWYDSRGRVLAIDMQKVRVGIAIRELRSMKNVIAVAGGIDKVAAIRGALAGGYIDTLITTEDVARELESA